MSKRDDSITIQTDNSNSDYKNKKSPVMKQVINKMVKAQIKKMVPRQVYMDCADEINKALYHNDSALIKHRKRFSEMKARRINNNTSTKNLLNLELDTS